jgi:DNA polymerase III subunit chi
MKKILFLETGNVAGEKLRQKLSRHIEDLVKTGASVAIRVPDEAAAVAWDQSLWTYRDESFLPHSVYRGSWPGGEPVTIAVEPMAPERDAVLICLADDAPASLTGFAQVHEVIDRTTPEGLERSRFRWQSWKQQGVEPEYLKTW